MIKNRVITLVYRTVFVVLCFIGIFINSDILEGSLNIDLLIYYTYITNILCLIVGTIVLIDNFKKVNSNDVVGYNDKIRKLKSATTMAILVTGVVYHFLLGDTSEAGFFGLDNLIVHYVVPFMFVLDWVIFDERGKIKVLDPLTWTFVPLIYMAYAMIRGAIIGEGGYIQYAYFFIDVNEYGYGGVFLWALGIASVFIVVGYLLWFIDKLNIVNGKVKINIKKENNIEE